MADDEYSVPGDVVEGVGGRTYSGGTFSGILPHPWPKRRPSTYSTASRSSQVRGTEVLPSSSWRTRLMGACGLGALRVTLAQNCRVQSE